MALMVSVVRRSRIPTEDEREVHAREHAALFGSSSDVPVFLKCPEDESLTAVVGLVHDLDAVRRISRTPEGDALMRKYGFIEQVNYFIEDA